MYAATPVTVGWLTPRSLGLLRHARETSDGGTAVYAAPVRWILALAVVLLASGCDLGEPDKLRADELGFPESSAKVVPDPCLVKKEELGRLFDVEIAETRHGSDGDARVCFYMSAGPYPPESPSGRVVVELHAKPAQSFVSEAIALGPPDRPRIWEPLSEDEGLGEHALIGPDERTVYLYRDGLVFWVWKNMGLRYEDMTKEDFAAMRQAEIDVLRLLPDSSG